MRAPKGRYGRTKRNTKKRHKAQHAKTTNQPPKACTRSLSTGGKMRGGTNGELCISHYAYNAFCYTSTGPLLLLFFCFLTTTMPTDDENQRRYDTPHKPQTARTYTHTQGNHTTHDPHTQPTPTRSAGQHTHTHQDQGEGHPGPPPPQPQDPRQEWRGTTPTALGQEWRETNHGTWRRPQPGIAGPRNQAPQEEWQGANHHRTTADPSQEWRGTAPRSLS